MLNSIRKKILAGNAILLLTLLAVLLYALGQLKTNQGLLVQQEQAEILLIELDELEVHFLEFQVSAVEFLILLEDQKETGPPISAHNKVSHGARPRFSC